MRASCKVVAVLGTLGLIGLLCANVATDLSSDVPALLRNWRQEAPPPMIYQSVQTTTTDQLVTTFLENRENATRTLGFRKFVIWGQVVRIDRRIGDASAEVVLRLSKNPHVGSVICLVQRQNTHQLDKLTLGHPVTMLVSGADLRDRTLRLYDASVFSSPDGQPPESLRLILAKDSLGTSKPSPKP